MSLPLLPVCQPSLPKADNILPYLRQIDENKWYTNFGPLLNEFLLRIANLFQIDRQHVMSGTNGTLLLELCLKALNVQPGTLCILPSWTFAATPLAVVAAKLEPLFVDVDLQTQALDPKKLLNDLPALSKKGKIGSVIVIAPFGQPIDVQAWDKFTETTDIPVVIDAAAAFDTILQDSLMRVSRTPMMVSMHATKVFGVGEGALLFSTNEKLIADLVCFTQFGFPLGIRNTHFPGTNAKLSEYVAAVGLAALDGWDATRTQWLKLINHYQTAFDKMGLQHMLSSSWATSTCNVIFPFQADALSTALSKSGIHTRKWWGDGCHQMPAFQTCKKTELKNTDYLSQSVLGLPLYLEMTPQDVMRVIDSTFSTCQNTHLQGLTQRHEYQL